MGFFNKAFKKDSFKKEKHIEVPASQKTSYVQGRGRSKKLFRISKPYGYFPDDVEAAVGKFESVIIKLKEVVNNYKQNEAELISKLEQSHAREEELKDTIKSLIMQLNLISNVPDLSDAQEHLILSQMKETLGTQQPLDINITDEDFHTVEEMPINTEEIVDLSDDVFILDNDSESKDSSESDDGVFHLD